MTKKTLPALDALIGPAFDQGDATPSVRYQVISPDGLPIEPKTYANETAAQAALARWCKRFQAQGYYASTSGRINLAQLPGQCKIVPAR